MHTDSDGQEVELKFRTHCLEKCSFDLETSWKTEEETVLSKETVPSDFLCQLILQHPSSSCLAPHTSLRLEVRSSFREMLGWLAGRLAAVCIL